ncbi:MAG: aspartyl protease family protein [Pseudomonadota bacterium]
MWILSIVGAFLLGRLTAPPATQDPVVAYLNPSFPAIASPAGSDGGETTALGPIEQAEALVRDGRPFEALAVLEAYLAETLPSARALFLLADLKQMTGETDAALLPLLEILNLQPDQETAERARRRLDLLVNAREQQLINAGDFVGLVNYFERLARLEPGYDGHRLKLTRWLLRSGEVAAARKLLREVGTVGVSQAEIDALAEEIRLAETSLPVEREAGAMYARAKVSGPRQQERFRFLVDTGATMSGLAESRLQALGAKRIEEGIRVQTANGVTVLPVYRLQSLEVGGVLVEDLAVLGFSDLPRGADGLLGMDVLSRLSGGLPTAVGRP